MKQWLFVLLLGSLCACTDKITVQAPTDFSPPENWPIKQIQWQGDTLRVVQGKAFGQTKIWTSVDSGINWQPLFDTDQEMSQYLPLAGLPFQGLSFGRGNLLWLYASDGSGWDTRWMPGWDLWKRGAYHPRWGLILVGGVNFGSGYIQRFNANFELGLRDSIGHELADLAWSSSSRLHAVGYGLVMYSEDGGYNWVRNDIQGDFYKAIQFVDSLNGYIIGDYGAVLKTSDGGKTWLTMRNTSTLGNRQQRHQAMFFRSAREGMIVGKNGGVWWTGDGGQSWTQVQGLLERDWTAISYRRGAWWLGSSQGELYRVQEWQEW